MLIVWLQLLLFKKLLPMGSHPMYSFKSKR
jgi:hypothetical protein